MIFFVLIYFTGIKNNPKPQDIRIPTLSFLSERLGIKHFLTTRMFSRQCNALILVKRLYRLLMLCKCNELVPYVSPLPPL